MRISALGKIFESYSAKWIESLRKYLDNINSVVHVTLYDANGEVKADDKLAVTVTKNDAFFMPTSCPTVPISPISPRLRPR